MFSNDRSELRRMYFDAWQCYQRGEPLDALQQIIVNIIAEHPEYHGALQSLDALERDFAADNGDTNPFLHMSMHIALHEQVSTDRPPGIRLLHQDLAARTGDLHRAEHLMMDCLSDALWHASRDKRTPDEDAYLACLRRLLA